MHPDGPGNPLKNILRRSRRFVNELVKRDVRAPARVRRSSIYLGTEYGGWSVIPELVPQNACVFSIGIGQDISFDLAMIARFGADVYGFDPTPVSMRWIQQQKLPSKFHFVPVGLADFDGVADFGLNRPDWESYSVLLPMNKSVDRAQCRVATIRTLAQEVNVKHIDILKIDIEGSEYKAVPDVLRSGFIFSQLLIELHYAADVPSQLAEARALLHLVEASGYRLFRRSAVGREFCFVHQSAS
jgi:FkbM family methyltransferase